MLVGLRAITGTLNYFCKIIKVEELLSSTLSTFYCRTYCIQLSTMSGSKKTLSGRLLCRAISVKLLICMALKGMCISVRQQILLHNKLQRTHYEL